MWFINYTWAQRVKHKATELTCYLMALCRFMLWLWYEQTAHLTRYISNDINYKHARAGDITVNSPALQREHFKLKARAFLTTTVNWLYVARVSNAKTQNTWGLQVYRWQCFRAVPEVYQSTKTMLVFTQEVKWIFAVHYFYSGIVCVYFHHSLL